MAKLLGGTTVYGDLSAFGTVWSLSSNSTQWDTAYSVVSSGVPNIFDQTLNSTDLPTFKNLGLTINSSNSLANNLVAFWSLDDAGDGTVLLDDSTGNGNTLTINGNVSLGVGKIDGCAIVSGGNNYLSIPAFYNGWSAITISLWVKIPESWSNRGNIISDDGPVGLSVGVDYSFIEYLWTNILNNSGSSVTSLTDNNWHNLILFYDSLAGIYGYATDAVIAKYNTTPGTNINVSGNLYFGKNDSFQSFSVDDIAIYNRALTNDEIIALFRNNTGRNYTQTVGLPVPRSVALHGDDISEFTVNNGITSPVYYGTTGSSYFGGYTTYPGGIGGCIVANGGSTCGIIGAGKGGCVDVSGSSTAGNGTFASPGADGGCIIMTGGISGGSDNNNSPGKGGCILAIGGSPTSGSTNSGGNAGCLIFNGGNGNEYGYGGGGGGTLNMSGGSATDSRNGYIGGCINTSNGGGNIDTTGKGCIGLGSASAYTQTMICGTITSGYNQTLCFPDTAGAGGTVALISNIPSSVYANGSGTPSIQPTVGGNTASGNYSVVSGGYANTASGCGAVVVGGSGKSQDLGGNTASGYNSVVVGGTANSAGNNYSTVLNGQYSSASGAYSVILGGCRNSDGGCSNVYILGQNITATASGYTYTNGLCVTGNICAPNGIVGCACILSGGGSSMSIVQAPTTFSNPVTASGSFLILNINGVNKAVQLWNYTS